MVPHGWADTLAGVDSTCCCDEHQNPLPWRKGPSSLPSDKRRKKRRPAQLSHTIGPPKGIEVRDVIDFYRFLSIFITPVKLIENNNISYEN